jgi:hypothetical protein
VVGIDVVGIHLVGIHLVGIHLVGIHLVGIHVVLRIRRSGNRPHLGVIVIPVSGTSLDDATGDARSGFCHLQRCRCP